MPPTSESSRSSNAIASTAARDRLIVALDYPDANEALQCVASLEKSIHWYKIGLELYLASGRDLVRTLIDKGFSVFLDLKLHDIPNTITGAVRTAACSGATLLTIHAAGGPAMIAAAAEAAHASVVKPRILAVTVLTSMDEQQLAATGVSGSPPEQVQRLASMALAAGANGLVCSAQESHTLRNLHGPGPLLVTPGIRPTGSTAGDQKRIATPAAAIQAGASYLVVGRPITQAAHPRQAAESILAEMQSAM